MSPRRSFIELTYYETYYFANVVKNVLEDQFSYLRNLDDFYGDDRYLAYTAPFSRFSALHSFIHFLIDEVISDDINDIKLDIRQDDAARLGSALNFHEPHPSKLPINFAFEQFGIVHENFETWLRLRGRSFLDATDEDVENYYDGFRLGGQFEELLGRATREVFFVLFQNRRILLKFNEMMASQLRLGAAGELERLSSGGVFARPGVLRRVAPPGWVKRAVYFRDRGMCVMCAADLSGVLAIGSEENYDHIVPLAAGGLNDVTNIQLLCKPCNSKKRIGRAITSNCYEAWYV